MFRITNKHFSVMPTPAGIHRAVVVMVGASPRSRRPMEARDKRNVLEGDRLRPGRGPNLGVGHVVVRDIEDRLAQRARMTLVELA
jgi:hypothetical protein